MELRDSADLLDPLRMIQDTYSLSQLRRAIAITGRGLMEAMRAAKPGLTTREVMEIADFVYRLNGATLGFGTGVQAGLQGLPIYATSREEHEAREGSQPIRGRSLVRHRRCLQALSTDIQRLVPANGKFTRAAEAYEVVVNVQKTVIANVKPARAGGSHDLA